MIKYYYLFKILNFWKMQSFDFWINALMERFEGGYVNDPDDPGGETKYGIAKRYNPTVDIKNLTREGAREIYLREYWKKCKCDMVPPEIRLQFFDMCVNPGPGAAVKILQQTLNHLGSNLKVDGALGPKTIAAAYADILSNETIALFRAEYYANLAVKTPSKKKFLAGWILRTTHIALIRL